MLDILNVFFYEKDYRQKCGQIIFWIMRNIHSGVHDVVYMKYVLFFIGV